MASVSRQLLIPATEEWSQNSSVPRLISFLGMATSNLWDQAGKEASIQAAFTWKQLTQAWREAGQKRVNPGLHNKYKK